MLVGDDPAKKIEEDYLDWQENRKRAGTEGQRGDYIRGGGISSCK